MNTGRPGQQAGHLPGAVKRNPAANPSIA